MRLEHIEVDETQNLVSATGDTGDTGDNGVTMRVSGVPGSVPVTGDTGGTRSPFEVKDNGVWYHLPEEPDKDQQPPQWICSRLDVTAQTRNDDSEAWGRLLEFTDPDGRAHQWACPMELLAADGAEFRRILLGMGLRIAPNPKARQHLATYVQTARTSSRAICTDKTGWHGGAFVLADETIGEDDERILLQVLAEPPKMRQAGTLDLWRADVAGPCTGNSRLLLAASSAFATPLLALTGREAGGVNFVGASSTGKTTALVVAASVWGGPEYLHRWRATSNGLEAVARTHNDALLVLDELAQVDPREAGEIAYMLANGSGKHRARKDGLARRAATWQLLFLSAGEIGLADHMNAAGKRARAGQEVRLADIPADAGAGMGMFEELHGRIDAATFADHLVQAAHTHYGTPAREYLRRLVALPREELRGRIQELVVDFTANSLPEGADGQARRVCERFGLIAAGGELATTFGLTGWPNGAAIAGAQACFRAWINRRGGSGSQEDARALAQVRHFIEVHGEARFTDLDHHTDRPTINRAGYRRVVDGATQFLILPEVFKREVCVGVDHRSVARMLRERGLLITEQADRLTIKPRGLGRVYALREVHHDAS